MILIIIFEISDDPLNFNMISIKSDIFAEWKFYQNYGINLFLDNKLVKFDNTNKYNDIFNNINLIHNTNSNYILIKHIYF